MRVFCPANFIGMFIEFPNEKIRNGCPANFIGECSLNSQMRKIEMGAVSGTMLVLLLGRV